LYKKDTNEYKLLICNIVEAEQYKNGKRFIGIDQGENIFATGYTNHEIIKFGTNLKEKNKKK
jgi:transposase